MRRNAVLVLALLTGISCGDDDKVVAAPEQVGIAALGGGTQAFEILWTKDVRAREEAISFVLCAFSVCQFKIRSGPQKALRNATNMGWPRLATVRACPRESETLPQKRVNPAGFSACAATPTGCACEGEARAA